MKIKFFLFIIAAGLLAGCGHAPKEKVLAVSVEPQRALLQEIAGDRYEVVTVLTPGSNPETFEPGMNIRRQLETASAYFTTGHLPFETQLGEALADVLTVDTSVGIQPVYGTHSHQHGAEHNHSHAHSHQHNGRDADPHVWTSVRNARIMAKNMYESLVALDPEGRGYYTARYVALDQRLDSLDRAFALRLKDSGTKQFAIWHPSLSYLARDYGLRQIAVGSENKEQSATVLRRVLENARNEGVRVFFFQKEFDSRQAEIINKELETELITINPLAYDWEKELDGIVSALCD